MKEEPGLKEQGMCCVPSHSALHSSKVAKLFKASQTIFPLQVLNLGNVFTVPGIVFTTPKLENKFLGNSFRSLIEGSVWPAYCSRHSQKEQDWLLYGEDWREYACACVY
jgi:hypothetical protein